MLQRQQFRHVPFFFDVPTTVGSLEVAMVLLEYTWFGSWLDMVTGNGIPEGSTSLLSVSGIICSA